MKRASPLSSLPKSGVKSVLSKPTAHKPPAFKPRPKSEPIKLPPSAARISRWRAPAVVILGLAASSAAFYPIYTIRTFQREAAALKEHPPSDTSYLYQSCADSFDQSVGSTEWLLGIGNLRSALLERARGHVLEMAVGTGRNAGFYPLTRGIKSMTMVDQSSEMVRVARMNWAKTNAWFVHAAFRIQSAAEPVPYPTIVQEAQAQAGQRSNRGGYDTVVQTMGVCSTGDPVEVLRNMGRLCKPEGKILLLEHGMAKYRWLNKIMDDIAPVHASRWGCWFNKDVGAIVRESGLEIVEEKRYHFGTTYWYVLKPPADRSILEAKSRDADEDESLLQQAAKQQSSWFKWWPDSD